MTIFAYRFPLELVFRIFDIIFAQGSEAVLRFALALVKNNADKIVTLTFEPLLEFLKTGLFDLYISNPNKLVADAQTISISKAKLSQLEQEFKEKLRKESPDFIDAEHYKHQNKQLMAAIKNLEHGFNILSKETDSLKIELTQAIDENANLTDKIESLEEQVEALKGVLTSDKNHAMAEVREEMDELAQKNVFLTNKNCNLEDAVQELQALVTHNQLLLEKAMERERFSE
jgi:chromosome segregation ATPase